MTEALLQTKLYIPPLRPNLVFRMRLIERLDQGLQQGCKLILTSAPAGFGKTTLTIDWIDHTPSTGDSQTSTTPRFCWLSLDHDDNQITRFFTYFVAALQTIEEKWGLAAMSLLQAPKPPPVVQIITLLINDVALSELTSPVVFVLDDYHVIRNQAIHQALSFLLDHAPPGFHLAIMTRSDPPLPLAQMRVRGEMAEIREADLRFTAEETDQFLNRMLGITLPPERTAALATRTEGWIAALQLAALALRGQDNARQMELVSSFGGAHAHVVDYLMDEVWQRQPEDVQNFWLATSVLDRLSGPLCDAVTGRNDSRQMLARLHRRNLFLAPLDSQRQWYRYHRLFADMLRARAAELGATKISQLHHRAAHWYEQQQLLPQAVHHALAADHQAEATRLISRAAEAALRQGDVAAIQGWLDALPAAHVRAHHQLALAKAWVSYLSGQVESAGDYLAAAQTAWPETTEPGQRLSMISLQAFIAILQGNIPAGIRLAQEALAMSTAVNQGLRELILLNLMQAQAAAGDIDGAVRSGYDALHLGRDTDNAFLAANILEGLLQLLLMQGELREALRLGEDATSRFVDKWNNPLPVAGPLYIVLGQTHLETGAVDRAYTITEQGITLSQQMAAAMPLVNGKVRLAQVQQLRGEGEAALAILSEVRQMSELPQLQLLVGALEAEINLRQGNVAASLNWADSADIPSLESPALQLELVYLAYAHCLLAGQRWTTADPLLTKLASAAREQGRVGSLVPIMVAQALSNKAQGKRSAAEDTLREAVLIAAPEGHKRPFLAELPQLIPLLQAIHPSAAEFVADLLSHTNLPALAAGPSILPDPLNERETEILRLIDAGNTNPEIAAELYLSVNTVKWYVKKIFQKLDVSSREEAAARARDLGLLP